MADANTGAAGLIRVDVSESGLDYANNRSVVNYAFYLIERTVYNYSFANGIGASVDWSGVVNVWSGAFSFDWRGAGQQSTLIASGSFTVQHNPDGSGYVTVQGNMNATGTTGAGGPASVAQGITLTNLKVIPGTPTGVVATRVSDTQTKLDWSQSSPSNGQPDTNTIQRSINGGAWSDLVTINTTTTATVATSANTKTQYRVRGNNAAGSSAYSVASAAIYTTPAAPTNAVATKGTSLDISVTFADNVAYTEHEHEIWHGVVSGGITTWDGAALATLPAGTTSYTHVAPNAAQVHIYQVRAKAGALFSSYTQSNSVQLLAAPNKPTIPAMPAIADKASALAFGWTHNPVDTTPQKAYEFSYSTNGGGAWSSTGKVVSTASTRTVAANTYAANTVLTMRVRTWGSATTGGSDGTGASPWSDLKAVTYKTVPVATIPAPANGSVLTDATLRVNLGFAQAEAASFVTATIRLIQGGVTIEELNTNTLLGTTLSTKVQNGTSYTVNARVQDSNGLWSAWAASTFSVSYLAPSFPEVALSYLEGKGYAQIDLGLPAPRTNLATNPSFETASGTVTVRTNLVTHPIADGNWSAGWGQGGGAGARTVVPDSRFPGGVASETTWTSAPTDMNSVFISSGGGIPVTPGVAYIISMFYTVTNWPGIVSNIYAPGGVLGVIHNDDMGGGLFRTWATWTPNVGTTTLGPTLSLRAGTTLPTTASTWRGGGSMLEASTILGDYFDGSTLAAGDFSFGWTGATKASTSVQTAPGILNLVQGNPERSAKFQSTEWSKSGSKSVRVIPILGASYAEFPVTTTPGLTYTVRATQHKLAPLTGVLDPGYAGTFLITAGPVISMKTKVPNLAGDYEAVGTFVASGTSHGIRLGNGASAGGGDVWWDDFIVVEGDYDGPWFAGGQSVTDTVTITREIDGEVETLVQGYPADSQLTFLDTTPTIHGVNTYTVTATSALGAKTAVEESLETAELRRAFLSKGAGYDVVGVFGANLTVSESLSVANATVEAAGRTKPIGLYGVETSVQLKVSSFMYEGFGSTIDEMRDILLLPGKACYRDPSGRRIFGTTRGSVSYKKATRGDLSFTMTETS
jgi:hypothetical protein